MVKQQFNQYEYWVVGWYLVGTGLILEFVIMYWVLGGNWVDVVGYFGGYCVVLFRRPRFNSQYEL